MTSNENERGLEGGVPAAEAASAPERLWTIGERMVPPAPESALEPRLRLGVSACLLGDEVRFNGGHSRDGFLAQTLGRYVEWVRVCPEVEIGLGTPRESIRLVGRDGEPRLVGPKSGGDHTDAMSAWSTEALQALDEVDLHGFIFKKGSPSCGLYRVRVYDEATGMAQRDGRGLFAAALASRFPTLPVEEDGRLHDPALRENFIERIFVHERWTRFLRDERSPGGLVRFHTAHKMSLLAHHPSLYTELGRLVADAGGRGFEDLLTRYEALFAEAMGTLAKRGRHSNVLQHLTGFLKAALSADEKTELGETIEDYRRGLLPLVVPITLIKHHFRRHDAPEWVHRQVYLTPYPKELMLRNHV
jgi:uncharacterized protein YbgA (DUF1722 family)/uncharacterized protein YbbK (DUF523 family)